MRALCGKFSNSATCYREDEKRTAHDARLIDVLQRVGLGALLTGDKPLDMWIGEGGRGFRVASSAELVLQERCCVMPLLLLDEPTEGLDKRTEREILSLLFEFVRINLADD